MPKRKVAPKKPESKSIPDEPERIRLWRAVIDYRAGIVATLQAWDAHKRHPKLELMVAPWRHLLSKIDNELSKPTGISLVGLRKLAALTVALPYDKDTLIRYVKQWLEVRKSDAIEADDLRGLAEHLLGQCVGSPVDVNELKAEVYRRKNAGQGLGGGDHNIATSIVELALSRAESKSSK